MRPVVGVDPSLKATGLARYDVDGTLTTGLVAAQVGEGLRGIAETVRYQLSSILRFTPRDALVVVESPIVARGGRGGLQLERAWLFGMLVDQLIQRGAPFATVHPSTRAMYATSNGKAEKPAVVASMRAVFPDAGVTDHNIADALALMAMGRRWLGEPVERSVTSKQVRAMRSAHWPIGEGEKQ